MRVLMLTEFFPRTAAVEVTGGVEARCYYVANAIDGDDEVEVLALRSSGDKWQAATLASIPRRLWFMSRLFVTALRRPFDVIEGTNFVVYPVAWAVGKLKRKRIAFWYPDVLIGQWRSEHFGLAGRVGELAERAILRLPVDRYAAITHAVVEKLARQGVDRRRIEMIPCGFPAAAVAEAKASPEVFDRPTIVVANRLVPYKNTATVVRALALVQREVPKAQLVVIGRGPDEPDLRRIAAEAGVADDVELRGHVERHVDVLRAIGGAQLFVSNSEIEGFGIVVLEAMALGTPYVVTDIPAFTEVTDGGVGGLLVPPGRPDELAAAMLALLSDTEGAASARVEGERLAAGRTWDSVADATRRFYRQVAASPRRRLFRRQPT